MSDSRSDELEVWIDTDTAIGVPGADVTVIHKTKYRPEVRAPSSRR